MLCCDAEEREMFSVDPKGYAHYAPQFNAHWYRFLQRYDVTDSSVPSVLTKLRRAYGGNDRHYHSLAHIVHLMDALGVVRRGWPEPFKNRNADAMIAWALWMHDCIYDTTRNDNELMSAQLAISMAPTGLNDIVRSGAAICIQTTTHRRTAVAEVAQIVCDLDLLSLAAPEHEFDENTRLIRLEYGRVSDEEWRKGRRAWGISFLDKKRRPSIYQTAYFKDRYEARARKNLAHMVKQLSD